MTATEPALPPADRVGRRALDLAALALFLLSLWLTLYGLAAALSTYDEGIVLTGSWLVRRGGVPYRDFYTQYPPGLFALIAGLWHVVEPTIVSTRWLGLSFHLALATAAGALGGVLAQRRFSPCAAALVLCWLVPTGSSATAWMCALAWAMGAACVALASSVAAPRRAVVCGLMLGVVGCVRHDLLVNVIVTGAVVAAIYRVPWRMLGLGVVGAALPVAAVWGPVLVQAPLHRVLGDLVQDQVRIVPSRQLPLPALWGPGLVPAALQQPHEGAAALALAGPLVGVGAFLAARRGLLDPGAAACITGLALATLPTVLRRSDTYHAIYSAVPAVLLLGALLDRLAWASRRKAALAIGLAVVAVLPLRGYLQLLTLPLALPRGAPPYGGVPDRMPDRGPLLQEIARLTGPDDPIFVARDDHRRLTINEVDLYFLARRRGGARYLQFDPGLATTARAQQEIIADLDRSGTRLVVMSTCCYFDEPNASREMGSDLLDRWLDRSFRVVSRGRNYWILQR